MGVENKSEINTMNVFDILKKHLEFKDNWGNNPYLPKDKVDALQKELEQLATERYNSGLREGNINILVGIEELFNKIVEEKKEELKVNNDRFDTIKSYFRWHRKFFKNAE